MMQIIKYIKSFDVRDLIKIKFLRCPIQFFYIFDDAKHQIYKIIQSKGSKNSDAQINHSMSMI